MGSYMSKCATDRSLEKMNDYQKENLSPVNGKCDDNNNSDGKNLTENDGKVLVGGNSSVKRILQEHNDTVTHEPDDWTEDFELRLSDDEKTAEGRDGDHDFDITRVKKEILDSSYPKVVIESNEEVEQRQRKNAKKRRKKKAKKGRDLKQRSLKDYFQTIKTEPQESENGVAKTEKMVCMKKLIRQLTYGCRIVLERLPKELLVKKETEDSKVEEKVNDDDGKTSEKTVHLYCRGCQILKKDRHSKQRRIECEKCKKYFEYACVKCKAQFNYYSVWARHAASCKGSSNAKVKKGKNVRKRRAGNSGFEKFYVCMVQSKACPSSVMKRYCTNCRVTSDNNILSDASSSCSKCKSQLKLKCEKCGEECSTYNTMLRHVKMKCLPDLYKCSLCSYRSHERFLICRHLQHVHGASLSKGIAKLPKKEENVVCEMCGKTYLRAYYDRTHKKVCGKEPKNHCPYCSYKSRFNGDVLRHIRTVHKELNITTLNDRNEARNKCSKSKNTEDKQKKSLSAKFSSKTIKHECSKCSKKFQSSNHLRMHKKVCQQAAEYI